ncbi:MAG: HesA/MoeB/ThiF family protein, partial [Clostridiales bacterium]|nr:HesA/MoeB/ThiF family protein [Clostridiales bacterium]
MNLDGERYSGNILIEQLGEAGQEKLYNGRVLIVGAGGLGSPAALYLAAAGVGTIGLCDDDQVAVSNLQRQVLYTVSDLSRPKVYQAKDRLFGLNPEVNICTYNFRFDRGRELFQDYDFVIDATDNIISKLEISDECVRLEKSFSHGSAMGMSGQTFTYLPG